MKADEMKKAAVLGHLKTAWEQICAAEEILAGRCELRNQIYSVFDSPLEDVMEEIKDGNFDDDFRLIDRRKA
jgi:hypothetical protein